MTPGPADTVLHADNYGHGPAYTGSRCDTCATIADRAAEARHGGRYITGALARAIDNDTIRRRFAGEDGPEALAEIWRYTASPSGSNYPASGRDTTQRYAREQAANGGVEWTHSAYWRPPMLPESAFDWPVYRAALRVHVANDVVRPSPLGRIDMGPCDDYAPDTLAPDPADRDVCTTCYYRHG